MHQGPEVILFLSKVAKQYSVAAIACNIDLETSITDSNRSIATLAITTLFKIFFL
jgi:coatomer protein complex subunit gamma